MDSDLQAEFNHIALLQHRAKNSGDTVLLQLPVLRVSEPPQAWNAITVAEFAADVDSVAGFLLAELNARTIPPRSAISLLCSGSAYQDLVYAIALARASYIPHMCTPIFTNPVVLFELMEKAGSKMLWYDPSLEHLTVGCPFPKMTLSPIKLIENSSAVNSASALPRSEDLVSQSSDIGFIFLTSGSTSGSPKVVPRTHKSLSVSFVGLDGNCHDTRDVFLGLESIAHPVGLEQYFKCLYTGSCFVKPSRGGPLSNEELSNMFNLCGLNRITTYGTWLVVYIRAAEKDPVILKLLQQMRSISYTGVAISTVDDDWCFQNCIPLTCVFGATECGPFMSSVHGKPSRFISPLPGVSYRFDLVTDITTRDNPASQLFEFVLLSGSLQIPQSHLLSADGNYHPGDLFEKLSDGSYVSCGRDDDWIKNSDADRVDAKAIEEQIYEKCSDLVKECVVVGYLRPSPALFIEVHHDKLSTVSEDSLKESILRRIEDFNARLCMHEQIQDKRLIFLVDEDVLPRTLKGNFRRRAIEQKYSNELDATYKSVFGSRIYMNGSLSSNS